MVVEYGLGLSHLLRETTLQAWLLPDLIEKNQLLIFDIKKISREDALLGVQTTSAQHEFLASLAVGQRAYVMARCPSCVRPSVRFFFKHL